ncbi:MAG: diguanylate cyclase [Phycisphaerae bacterium]|nr:diguanylate cyclase [Phycisphaerae bacterium]
MLVDRAMTKQAETRREHVLDLINRLTVLPTTANVPMRILKLQRSPSASAAQFAALLIADSCLCSKLLGLANSAWFSPARPITKVSDAISMIGLRNLMPLVFATAIAGVYDQVGLSPSVRRRFWEASVFKAVAARECASHLAPEYAEEAFICGQLQDIALPLLFSVDMTVWPETEELLHCQTEYRREREQMLYGADHADLGGRLVKRLGFPAFFQETTRGHHDAPALRGMLTHQGLARSIEFAAMMPHNPSHRGMDVDRLAEFFESTRTEDSPEIQPAALLADIERHYRTMLEIMSDEGGGDGALRSFIREASQELCVRLESMIGESCMMTSTFATLERELKEKIQQLEWRATELDYDGLTGILNRRGLLSRTEEVFTKASDLGIGCAIGFVDLDDFKDINDRYGHPLGDLVLKSVSESLQEALHGCGIVGRYGGDEFTFLLIADEPSEAMAVTDRIATALGDLTVQDNRVCVHVSASIGLLWVGTPTGSNKLETALKEADKLMYEAKRSGGSKYVLGELKSAG